MSQLAPVTRHMLESQLKGLAHGRTRGGAVGTLLLLLSRGLDEPLLPLLADYIPQLAAILADPDQGAPGGEPDGSVQPNAAAVLGAAASLSDELNKAVDGAAVSGGRFRRVCWDCRSVCCV